MRHVLPLLLLAIALTAGGRAQEGAGTTELGPERQGPDKHELDARLQAARDLEAVEGDTRRGTLILEYTKALASVESAEQWAERRRALLAEEAAAPNRKAKLEIELAEDPKPMPSLDGLSVEDLEEAEVEARAARDSINSELDAIQAEQLGAADRRRDIAQQLAALVGEIEGHDETLRVGALVDEDGELASARLARVGAERYEAAAHADALRADEQTYDERADVRALEERVARKRATRAEAELQAIDAALLAERRAQAERERLDAERSAREAIMQGAEFKRVADTTLAIREDSVEITERLEEIVADLTATQAEASELLKRFDETKRRVEIVGLTDAISLKLRQERLWIVDARARLASTTDVQGELTDTQEQILDRSIQRDELSDEAYWIDRLVQMAAVEGTSEDVAKPLARQLLQDRFDALRASIDILDTKFDRLVELDVARSEVRDKLQEYDEFVGERVLWIRSARPVWDIPAEHYASEVRELVDVENWRRSIQIVRDGAQAQPGPIAFVLLGLFALLGLRPRARRALVVEGSAALERQQVSILPTLRALLYTSVLAFTYAAPLLAVSYLATSVFGADPIAKALGMACERAAAAALIFGSLRALTAKHGLGECHFEWPERVVRLVRRQATIVLPITPTAALAGDFLLNVDTTAAADVFARTAFAVEAGSILFFAWRVLHPSTGIFSVPSAASGNVDFVHRLRRLWFLIAVGVLGSLLVLVVLGYGYTARNLLGRLEFTVAFLLALAVLRALSLRWILLVRRGEALERRRRKREEARQKRLAEIERLRDAGEDVAELESQGLAVEEEVPDFAAMSADVRDLVRLGTGIAGIAGVVAIWSPVLPALGFFDRVRLWQREVPVTESTQLADGTMQETVMQVTEWVSLVNVGAAVLVLLLTWVVVRNISSVLELLIFRRLEIGSGERYAISTLVRYLIILVGVAVAFQELGVTWSKLQWLVAGVSVGLGFGLQEIFANFVSGITLLFERPVRVGDWVTLGEVEGVVSKIRIRATTIRDRDLKELVVPNREFINGSFINWTLSDPVSRVTLAVGIAYGSDTEEAIRQLLEAGRSSSYTVDEPSPNVVFCGFGESSLDFELRVFVSGRESIPRVVHDLHMRVDTAFRAAGVEISFPQRDLHVRSAEGLAADLEGPRKRQGNGATRRDAAGS